VSEPRAAGTPCGSTGFGASTAGPPLIGLAHGSRHPGVAASIERLVAAAGAEAGVPARAAYLDLVDPDLTTVATELAAAGHRRAVAVPLLFTTAFHARVDVPEAIAAAAATAGIELVHADVLGTGADVEALLRDSLAAHPSAAPVLLFAVGSSDPTANASVHDLAERLGAGRDGAVRAGFATTEPRAGAVLTELAELTGATELSGRATLIVLPLFLAPGLLLDPVLASAAERGWTLLEPLAERAAPVLVRRYLDGAGSVGPLG
jgi:sirohydrochlorin ferrochelatase